MIKWIQQLFQSACALAAASAAGSWAINHAYACRGYDAAGSEYIFILIVYCISYKTAGLFVCFAENMRRKYEISRRNKSCQKNYDLCQEQDRPNNILIWYDKRKFPLTERQVQHKEDKKC